jgi:methylmalonyl-CoA mutase N-terminal domain/subunit
VGVTHHAEAAGAQPESIPVQRVAPERIAMQIERVRASRERRDAAAAEAARERIRGLAGDPADNAFAAVVDGARAGLTHGELVAATRDAFGFGRPLTLV